MWPIRQRHFTPGQKLGQENCGISPVGGDPGGKTIRCRSMASPARDEVPFTLRCAAKVRCTCIGDWDEIEQGGEAWSIGMWRLVNALGGFRASVLKMLAGGIETRLATGNTVNNLRNHYTARALFTPRIKKGTRHYADSNKKSGGVHPARDHGRGQFGGNVGGHLGARLGQGTGCGES